MRLGVKDGRLVVTDLLISADDINAATLRAVQPARVVAQAVAAGGGSMVKLAALPGVQRPDDTLTLAALRRRRPAVHVSTPRAPLRRPDGSNAPNFYADVARMYISAAAESRQPVQLLATEAGVPAETVRRWVKEARRRHPELLPAGKKGRAG